MRHAIPIRTFSLPAIAACSAFLAPAAASAVNLEFSGFGDLSMAYQFGSVADTRTLALFEQYGVGKTPVNEQRWFGVAGTDFVVLAHLSERLTYLGEINLQVERDQSSEFELDVERMMLDYRLWDWFSLQAGLFFTPVGFQNRTHYARAWMMYSARIHDFFEEQNNFVPTHTVGVHLYGALPRFLDAKLHYAISLGNGRAAVADAAIYARNPNDPSEVAGRLELELPGFKDFRVGLSGWTNEIRSVRVRALGDIVDPDDPNAEHIRLREIGFNPYITFYSRYVNILLEYVYSEQRDERGNLGGRIYTFQALTAEVSLNLFDDVLHPYVRYDLTQFAAGGGFYLSLRESDAGIARHYIPEFNAAMVGIAYDVHLLNRLKLEYVRHFDGPRRDTVMVQTAFGF